MAITMRGNSFNVRPGDRAFNILTNKCNYFQIGVPTGDDVWLEGQIVEGEFIFNGRLYLRDGGLGTVIDSFPKGPASGGWSQRRKPDVEGYELIDNKSEVIFSYHVEGLTCVIDVDLYKADGSLAAHGGQGGLVAHVPVLIGRNGILIE